MIKAILLSLFVFSFSLWGAEPKVVNVDKLQKRGEAGSQLTYIPNQDTPFTGKAVGYWPNGQKEMEWNYKDGIKEGLVNGWYESGQKAGEANYKDGKNDGLSTSWYKNGEKRIEQTCKDGKPMSAKAWKPNGEKCPVTNLKDGNGVWVVYDEAGTEWFRDTFKDGLKVERLTP
jgi:antitoxin component YwqK of YwqJK toxin-antitoxin module